MKTTLISLALAGLVLGNFAKADEAEAKPEQALNEAQECTQILNRLQRLDCFDSVFDTPIDPTTLTISKELEEPRPQIWFKVVEQEKKRDAGDTFFLSNYVEDDGEDTPVSGQGQTGEPEDMDIVLTQKAIGVLPPRPMMVISCIDDITRLQLLLHKPIDEGITPLTLVIDGRNLASRWFSESNGYMIRAGRGLPGIQDIKAMLRKERVTIKSKEAAIDGLTFELAELEKTIRPLRKTCGW